MANAMMVPSTEQLYDKVTPQTNAPQDYLNVQAKPEDFGSQVGAAMSNSAAQGAQTADKLSDAIAQAQHLQSEATVNQAQSSYLSRANAILHAPPQVDSNGNPVPGTGGFFAQRGDNSKAAYPAALQQIDDARDMARENMTPRQQLMFDQLTRRMHDYTIQDMGRHVDQQVNAAYDKKTEGLLGTLSQSAALAGSSGDIGPDTKFADLIQQGEAAAKNWGALRGNGVWGDNQALLFTGQTVNNAIKQRIDANDYKGAEGLLMAYRDRMDKGSQVQAEGALKSHELSIKATRIGDEALGRTPAAQSGLRDASDTSTQNNLGNIKVGATNQMFRSYAAPEDGAADAARLLRTPQYAGKTLADIGRTWEGTSPQNIQNWVANVSRASGIAPGDTPNLDDPAVLQRLISGIATAEKSPQDRARFTPEVISSGVSAALSGKSVAFGVGGGAPRAVAMGDKAATLARLNEQYKDQPELLHRVTSYVDGQYAIASAAATAQQALVQQGKNDAADEYLKAVHQPGANAAALVARATADPRLDYHMRKDVLSMIESSGDKGDGPAYSDTFMGIFAPPGSPQRIDNTTQLLALAGEKKLTPGGFEKLNKVLEDRNSPEGKASAHLNAPFLEVAKATINPKGFVTDLPGDPSALRNMSAFIDTYRTAYAKGIEKGYTPQDMLTEKGAHSLYPLMQQFKVSMGDAINHDAAPPPPAKLEDFTSYDDLRNAWQAGKLDHLSRGAVIQYAEKLGGKYKTPVAPMGN